MKGKKKFPKQRIRKEWRVKVKQPPWTELPAEITANILYRLGVVDILDVAQKVCTTWRRVCQDPAMWRVIDMSNDDDLEEFLEPEKICRVAVDRSQGQLVDIDAHYFCSDELLLYIAQRSPKLRRLRFSYSYVSDEGLSKAVKSFPSLEELHIYMPSINKETIKAIGHLCPKLKTFTLRVRRNRDIKCNESAIAISQCMPGLCHLGLVGDKLTIEGLEAILDGCCHLESLDLRKCFNINVEGDLGKRISQQIKCIKYPNDPIEGNEFDADDCVWDSDDLPSEFSDVLTYYDGYDDLYDDPFDYDDFTRLSYHGSDSDFEFWFGD